MKIIMQILSWSLVSAILGLTSCAPAPEEERIKTSQRDAVDFRVLPFEIGDVALLDGPFLHATQQNEEILLAYEPDRFLAKFRSEAGLEPKAEHYHGWEDNTIAGHSLGHYLTAIVLMYQTTRNPELLRRVHYIVDELYDCQEADGEGYIGAFPDGKRILEEEVAKGDIRSQGFNLNGIWVPFYTQHKVMDGLFHAYKFCGNQKALEINVRFANWLATIVENLNDEQIQKMLHCEHGGINEALVELYACTGNEKFLELSRVFHHKAILDPLAEGKDILPGKHANTQIPKLIGLARRYELTGDSTDRKTAEFFWERVVHHHSYVTGGNGNHEYFGPPDTLNERLSANTTESCNVYNMLKLSRHLILWEARPEVFDFYERALFNHILSSQHPQNGHVIYNLSLEMGGFKVYQDPEWFTCCVGTGMENHSKYSRNIYYYNNEALYVGQFIASELNWSAKGVKLRQSTSFPDEQQTSLAIACEQPVRFTLKVRYPYWAQKGMTIRVNGKKVRVKESPGSFVALNREWNNGDVITVSFPFTLRLENMPDNPNRIALMYGPLVMAGDLGPVPDPNSLDPMYVPVLMTSDRNPETWLTRLDEGSNLFRSHDVGRPRDVEFQPFYKTHDRHYSVYFDLFTDEQWKTYQEEYEAEQARKKELEAKTIDLFRLGEMQPERDHHFEGERCWNDEFKGKKYREIDRGGWMSFTMRTLPNEPNSLVFEYWGGYSGSKTFDILVEGERIATENISALSKSKFIDIAYPIPDRLTIGRGKVDVKLVPHYGHRGGPVFTVRTIKTNSISD
ncbi:MAG TPA: glycoside hydrolase family 127 protein [Prolixibacteraceae bacterium]|nr:glycoside hydrolase family 127 protein [Prolixibacteraceae bacterium]